MRPAPFEYAVAADVDQAIGLLGQFGDEAKVLAGGQSLVPMLNFRLVRPRYLIDIGRIKGLDFVSLVDGGLHIGALTRQRTVERSDLVRDVCPLLAEAIKHVGHQQTRNRGTIGGSLAHADPAAELPAVVTALDARLRLKSIAGERVLQAREFFQGSLTTALRPNELLVAVEILRAGRSGQDRLSANTAGARAILPSWALQRSCSARRMAGSLDWGSR